jgi:uncharacterized membrane protein YtjA (UPF0391 family)
MLGWAFIFLILALLAAILGLGTAANIAPVLFLVFLILFLVSLFRGRKHPLG